MSEFKDDFEWKSGIPLKDWKPRIVDYSRKALKDELDAQKTFEASVIIITLMLCIGIIIIKLCAYLFPWNV